MRYTVLGGTGLRISVIGFGGIPIRRLSHADGVEVVRRAFERGVTYYDTARGYGDSEDKIGEALHDVRDRVVLASKTPTQTREEAAAAIDESLKHLRTDYIDLYQLHHVSTEAKFKAVTGPGGALEALQAAKQAGKIGHIGITSHNRDLAPEMIATGLFETLMLPFSYLEDEPLKKALPLCTELNVGFIAMKPFSGGALDTPEQCLKWVLSQPGLGVVIPGMGSLAEVEQDVAVADADWALTPADTALMAATTATVGKSHCRGCDYCQPCTSSIPISTVLRSISLLRRQGAAYMMNGTFDKMVAWVDSCTQCRECEPRCPYNLPIPELLPERIAELRAGIRSAGWNV